MPSIVMIYDHIRISFLHTKMGRLVVDTGDAVDQL